MNAIDSVLNKVTMYRLVVYYLGALIALAAVLGYVGLLPYSPAALAYSTGVLLAVSSIADLVLARIFGSEPGRDSAIITALILVLIMNPVLPSDVSGLFLLAFVSVWAIGSKYVLAWRKKQVFNPAAFAVAFAALFAGQAATWWVGNILLAPAVIIGGFLIVRKIERLDLFFAFAGTALATIIATSLASPLPAIWNTLAHSSFFFLGFVMLTEPSTMPPTRWLRIVYGVLAGFLFAPAVHLFSYYFTPETALLAASLFSFAVSQKGKFLLTLKERKKLANGIYEFSFVPDRAFSYKPGQYMEWTLPGEGSDSRGNRRYFTIASAPEEGVIRLGVKFYEPMSSFKRRLFAMRPGDTIMAGQLGGDFVLPKDAAQKLVFIAGGIGITPFNSMIEHMVRSKDYRDTHLMYVNKTGADIAYRDLLERAETEAHIAMTPVITGEKTTVPAQVDAALIAREIPDYQERQFYLSGPHGMVEAYAGVLRELGIPRSHIKKDFFPGFA